MRLRENATDPKRGDALCNDDGIKFYTGVGWLNCPDFQLSDYYTKVEADARYLPLSGGVVDVLSVGYPNGGNGLALKPNITGGELWITAVRD